MQLFAVCYLKKWSFRIVKKWEKSLTTNVVLGQKSNVSNSTERYFRLS